MATNHIHRNTVRTAEETAKLRADRERYQRDKPSPEQLLAEGGYDRFIPIGELLQIHELAMWLKQERERQKISLADLEERTGIDQAALSRLENGKNTNPTIDTLYRVSAALGKRLCFSCQDAVPEPAHA